MLDTELVFNSRNGDLVVIMNNVIQRLLSYRQLHSFSKESAGVLIGERRGSHLVICDLSEPGLGDIRYRYSVNRRGSIIKPRYTLHSPVLAVPNNIWENGTPTLKTILNRPTRINYLGNVILMPQPL